uniref:Putative gland protein G15A10 n=1 Tax=Heterodera glycines TaxID=51029 RepID=Q86DF7_HETGL|nr:putative gland protein G15A10 [Heterodera glycines]
MEAGDVDIIRQQHIRYYADIDGRKYPTEGPDYDVLLYGTDLLVDGKLYKNAVPTGYINYINRIEERIPVLGSSGRSIQLNAAGDDQGNNARLHTNVVGHQISGSVSLPEIPIGGNSDYINTGHNKHDGKPTFGDTKREEKQKNKQKQQKRGELIGGNFTHINNQNNENIGGTQDIGRIQIGGMPPGGALHLNTGGNRNVGGTQMIGGIKIGKMPTGGTFGLNIGGNRNVGGTQEIGSSQGLYNRSNTGDLTHALRQQRTEDNHISINGQIYSVDGPNVNVGVEGHDLSVNGRVYQNRATEQYLEIIQDKNIRNVIVSVPLSLFSRENTTVGQTRHIHAECDGNLYIDQSADDCIRILCVDVKKDAAAKNFGSTSGGFNFGSTSVFYNFSVRGTLHIHNSSLECANIECDASLNVTHSPIERNAQMKCGGSLSIDESPMGNIRLNCDGSLRIEKSKMESSQIDVGGSIGIVESPMGSIGIDCGGS